MRAQYFLKLFNLTRQIQSGIQMQKARFSHPFLLDTTIILQPPSCAGRTTLQVPFPESKILKGYKSVDDNKFRVTEDF